MTFANDNELEACGPAALVFRLGHLQGLRFELRPASQLPPPSHAVAFLYRREGGSVVRFGIGHLKEGVWTSERNKPLDPEGLYWTAMVNERAGAAE